jgi:signal transduction histidine kinase
VAALPSAAVPYGGWPAIAGLLVAALAVVVAQLRQRRLLERAARLTAQLDASNARLRDEAAARAAAEAALAEEHGRLAEREARLRSVVTTADAFVASWRHGHGPRFEHVSDGARAVLGIEPEDVLRDAEALLGQVQPPDRGAFEHALARPEDAPRPLRVHAARPGRAPATLDVFFLPVHDGDGRVVGADLLAWDVTEQAAADEAKDDLIQHLEHEHAWLSAVLERAPVALLLVPKLQPPGGVVLANRCAIELFGPDMDPRAPLEAFRRSVRRPGGQPLEADQYPTLRALRGETIGREELEIHRDHGAVPVVVHGGPIQSPSGGILGAVLVVEDVSTPRELERLRDAWTAVVAHDLRSPITSIRMLATALARQPRTPPETAEKLGLIAQAAERLAHLVRDLLDASKLTVEQMTIERSEVELEPLLRRVVERLSLQAQGREVRLSVAAGIPRLHLDGERIEQVVENLVTNALRYGFERTPVDVVALHDGAGTRIAVTNEGPGIDPEERGQLFHRFGRTRTGRGQGARSTGLGLYIADGLVKAHGGSILVESTPDATTTFVVVLPDETCVAGHGS